MGVRRQRGRKAAPDWRDRTARRRLLRGRDENFAGFGRVLLQRGNSPKAIQEDFPLLKLAQIHGAVTFYLDHQAEIDKYLAETEREFEASGIPIAEANPVLWEKIQRARAKMGESRRLQFDAADFDS